MSSAAPKRWLQRNRGTTVLPQAPAASWPGWVSIPAPPSYYLDDSGHIVTGWVQNGGTWYLKANIGGRRLLDLRRRLRYHLGADGAMTTGWFQDGDTTGTTWTPLVREDGLDGSASADTLATSAHSGAWLITHTSPPPRTKRGGADHQEGGRTLVRTTATPVTSAAQ